MHFDGSCEVSITDTCYRSDSLHSKPQSDRQSFSSNRLWNNNQTRGRIQGWAFPNHGTIKTTQKVQYPLMREYSLDSTRMPNMV